MDEKRKNTWSSWKDAGEGRDHHSCHSTSVLGGARNIGLASGVEFAFFFAPRCRLLTESLTIEQIATQLQPEVTTLQAHFADQTGLAELVRVINNLATA